MDPQVASLLAALGGAGASSSYAAPSSQPLAGAGGGMGSVSWDVPNTGVPSPYMPTGSGALALAPVPPPAPDAAMAQAAPPLAAAPAMVTSAPDAPASAPAMPTDPGTMPGSLGAGAPAQPGAPLALGAGQMAPGTAQPQIPDFYRALFSGAGQGAPAAGYGGGT